MSEQRQTPIDERAEERRHAKSGPHGGPGRWANVEKPRDFKGTLAKMLAYLGRYRIALVIVFILAIGSTVFSVIGPKVLSTATTELFNGLVAKVNGTGGIDFDAIAGILIATFLIYVCSAVCAFVQGWAMATVTQKTCYRLRQDIAEKINKMPFGYFERNSIGDTLSRITNDIDTLGQTLNQGLTQLITSIVTLVGVIVMMLSINVIMTLVVLLIIPLTVAFLIKYMKFSQKFFMIQQNTLGDINGIVEETFSGHAVVRAFNQQEQTAGKFDVANTRLYDSGWKAQFASSFIKPVMDFIGNLAYVAVAILGSYFAAMGIITVGDIQAFIQYVKNFTHPMVQLAQISNVFQQMAAAAERIFDFLSEEELSPVEDALEVPAGESSVEFAHVRFGYDPDKPVIKDFSARVEPGQTVALVGPTGAGKTTMVKLLMRFYDVQDGAILIDGRDIREYERDDLRSLFGMVLQDTWLFSGTIRENIRYGKPDATDEEVEQSARIGYAHHFIQTLPGGYDFVINEDAGNISQGQRQLLTIARAVLANRRMLILDEATSSVDTRTEERIQEAMDALMAGRTSFVIAHRLSTIRSADLILVMQEGDIVEQGTHAELLALDGFYAELYNSQFKVLSDG